MYIDDRNQLFDFLDEIDTILQKYENDTSIFNDINEVGIKLNDFIQEADDYFGLEEENDIEEDELNDISEDELQEIDIDDDEPNIYASNVNETQRNRNPLINELETNRPILRNAQERQLGEPIQTQNIQTEDLSEDKEEDRLREIERLRRQALEEYEAAYEN